MHLERVEMVVGVLLVVVVVVQVVVTVVVVEVVVTIVGLASRLKFNIFRLG